MIWGVDMVRFFLTLFLALAWFAPAAQAGLVARTILVPLANDKTDPTFSAAHQAAEVVSNYYGLKLEYLSLDKPLPDLQKRPDVRGVLSWLPSGVVLSDPEGYYAWLFEAQKANKRLVFMGEVFPLDAQGNGPSLKSINRVLHVLGVHVDGLWVSDGYTYTEVIKAKGYETAMPTQPPSGFRATLQSDALEPIALYEQNSGENLPLLAAGVSPNKGGFAMNDFALKEVGEGDALERRWVINPFDFFARSFGLINLPKPDVTTMLGTRLYFSHVDGDGWRSNAQLERYKHDPKTNAEVLLEEVLLKTPDLPTTVAPIAAELDLAWSGTNATQEVVRKMFALPHVEPSSHTYSHPFSWGFYKPDSFAPELEKKFEGLYPKCGKAHQNIIHAHPQQTGGYGGAGTADENLLAGYELPRAFGCEPATAELETAKAAAYISQFSPENKPVRLVQWSGDTKPFAEALAAAETAGLFHMNGGNTRFDNAYPSYAHVSPIGIQKGGFWQVYAPMSNENNYTNLWAGPYHGLKYLTQTLQNTGQPYRLKPMNVYYHTYSAEKDASLNSLLEVLDYVRRQRILPIQASEYAQIAQGFYTAELTAEKGGWTVKNRGRLQTIRFDEAAFKKVDFQKSVGVIGQRHFGGSLYVSLNPEVTKPFIVLATNEAYFQSPSAPQPYILESKWPVQTFNVTQNGIYAETEGFGSGSLVLRFPEPIEAHFTITQGDATQHIKASTAGVENLLTIPLMQTGALTPTKVRVRW